MTKHLQVIKVAARVALGLVFLAGWGAKAMALPALDCEQAAALPQRIICSDSLLAGLFQSLEKVLEKSQGSLTESASALVSEDLNVWTAYIGRRCEEDVKCIADELEAAIRVYSGYPDLVAGYRIFPRTYFSARKSAAESSWNAFALDETIYPQIDLGRLEGDALAEATRINAWLWPSPHPQQSSAMEGFSDSYVKVELDALNPGILVRIASSHWYGHGAAHGHSGSGRSYWHSERGEELRPDDVFEGTQWPQALAEIALALLGGRYGRDHLFVKEPNNLVDSISDMKGWSLGRDRLVLYFAEYEVLPYVYGQPEVSIPWENLGDLVTEWWQKELERDWSGLRPE